MILAFDPDMIGQGNLTFEGVTINERLNPAEQAYSFWLAGSGGVISYDRTQTLNQAISTTLSPDQYKVIQGLAPSTVNSFVATFNHTL